MSIFQVADGLPPHAHPLGQLLLAECVLLAPLLLLFYLLEPGSSPMPQALGLSFALSLIFFCLFHTWLEWKESRDCA